MVLFLNGVRQEVCPLNSRSLFNAYPMYKTSACKFAASPIKEIGPAGLLYVFQKEFATTVINDSDVKVIGSDDATTCIIAVIRHSQSYTLALGHLDNCEEAENTINKMIQKVQDFSKGYDGYFDLRLVGGYFDGYNDKDELFYSIMSTCSKHKAEIRLNLACVGGPNTMMRGGINCPVIYGIGIEILTGQIFPARFTIKGPETIMRLARCFAGSSEVFDIYDSVTNLLTIGPYYFKNNISSSRLDELLSQSDDVILSQCSTSPWVEPPNFVEETRAALRFIKENKISTIAEFKKNCPLYFRRCDSTGLWMAKCSQNSDVKKKFIDFNTL